MKTLDQVLQEHDKRKDFKTLVKELSKKQAAGEISHDELVEHLEAFEESI